MNRLRYRITYDLVRMASRLAPGSAVELWLVHRLLAVKFGYVR